MLRNLASCVIVGRGDDEDMMRDLVVKLNLSGIIKFEGYVENSAIPEFLARADVLINSSIWPENHSTTIIEAMSASLGVIATNLGGNTELIEDKINGLLYSTSSVQELQACCLYFVNFPQIIEQYGKSALSRMNNNHLQIRAAQLLKIYSEI